MLLEIINKVDKEIKNKRLYLSKEHRNGIFNFQEFYDKYVPYYVDKEKKLQPILNDTLTQINKIDDVRFNAINIHDYYKFAEHFLNEGVIAKTLLVDKNGNVILSYYYKNLVPKNYIGKINIPEHENILIGNFLYHISEGVEHKIDDIIELELKTHFHESIRKLFKIENKNFSSRIFTLKLEKENKPINLNEIISNLKIIIDRLDDTCFNIFTRVDRLNYLLEHKQEIKNLLQENFNSQDREKFNQFYNEQKEWFYLLSEAIDLTRNKYYKDKVDEKIMKNQTKELNELIQFISYSLYLNNENVNKKKLKI